MMQRERFDVSIIGGGINGAGIARDLACRGISTLLLEANDFGGGTTAYSTRLIHGGLRYLEFFDIPLVRESLRERQILLNIANHLVYPLLFLLPIYAGQAPGPLKLELGLTLYDWLAGNKTLPNHHKFSQQQTLDLVPALNPDDLCGAFVYYDCQTPLPERLVLENILDAETNGAVCLNYHKVEAIHRIDGNNFLVQTRDQETGLEREYIAKVVINAAGPWVNEVARLVDETAPKLVGGTKGSHLIVENRLGLDEALYSPAKSDGRPFFIVPLSKRELLIGTTDIFFDESPERARTSWREVEYLVSEANLLCPSLQLTVDDVILTYCGVRPLPPENGKRAGEITRRHFLYQHQIQGKKSRLISVVGGKITTYRQLAEEAGDLVRRLLNNNYRDSQTEKRLLPGAWELDEIRCNGAATRAFPKLSDNPLLLYGKLAGVIEPYVVLRPELKVRLHPDHNEMAAQVVYAAEKEKVKHLEDFMLRRTMLAFKTGFDKSLAARVAHLLGEALGWAEEKKRQEVKSYLAAIQSSLAWRLERWVKAETAIQVFKQSWKNKVSAN